MSKIKKITIILAIFFIFSLLRLPAFVYSHFGEMDIEQIIFVLLGNNTGANIDIVFLYLRGALLNLVFAILIVFIISHVRDKFSQYELEIKISFFNFKKNIVSNIDVGYKLILFTTIISMLFVSFVYDRNYKISAYIKGQSQVGTFYEDNYINPNDIPIVFPQDKKNLIYIIAESMNTNFTSMNIDGSNVNLIPKLEMLANENYSFSHNDAFGGHTPVRGTTWTMGSLVAQTAGIPLAGPLSGNTYGKTGQFLPGVKSLGHILQENGYKNYFSIGSAAQFAGRDVYFDTHGDYEIFDLQYWKDYGKIPQDYHVFWGMEDEKLIDYSKEKLLEISKNEEPFNFTMLTVDSHYIDGYTDNNCNLQYDTAYANAISCSDNNVYEFVQWIKQQDFYKDTVIVLVGDHPTMNQEFLLQSSISEKHVYNAFINISPELASSIKMQNRLFNPTDLFPTTLAALNIRIEGDRLGLGTNLFSDSATLMEEMGKEEYDEGLSLRSNFYNRRFHRGLDD